MLKSAEEIKFLQRRKKNKNIIKMSTALHFNDVIVMTLNSIILRVSKVEMTSKLHAHCCGKLKAFNIKLTTLSHQFHQFS